MSGRLLLNFTRQTRSDLQRHNITGVHTRTHNRIIITIKQKQKLSTQSHIQNKNYKYMCAHMYHFSFGPQFPFHKINSFEERERESDETSESILLLLLSQKTDPIRETESRMGGVGWGGGGCA